VNFRSVFGRSMRLSPLGTVIVALAVAGCHAPAPARPVAVSAGVIVVPAGGGMADFEVHRDGTMRGGHLSGAAPPYLVHQDDGHLGAAVADSLWTLLSALGDSLRALNQPPPSRWHGYTQLQVAFATGAPMVIAWPQGAEPPEPGIRAVVDWLMAHRIGAW
jgi:hypothetical protein